LPKVKGRFDRGGGVTHFDNTYWGPINILDGGRDAPAGPLSTKGRIALWIVLAAAVVVAIVVVVITL
jgi:hypothetical protein